MVKMNPHIPMDKVYQGGIDHFRHGLLPGNAGDLQAGAQPDAQGRNQDHHQPADH